MIWEKVRLKDLVTMKYGKMPNKEDIIEEGYPIYSGYRITSFHKEYLFKEPQLIIVARGVGGTGDVKISPPFCYLTNLSIALLTNDDIVDKYFLRYRLSVQNLRSLDSGAAQSQITIGALEQFETTIPSLPTQRKIASILSAYDDLIENNLKRIKLLEHKAFLRYKQIVREENAAEKKLNQVTLFLKRGISPKYVNEEGIVVLNQKCIRNHIVSFDESRLTDCEKSIPEERMLRKFDTLINSTGTGTLGRIAMNIQDELPLTVDSHITIVRANNEITPIYLCMSLFAMERVIEMMGEGATNQTELSPKKIGEEIRIPIVSDLLMSEYEKETESIFNLIWNLQKQNTKLREARDILLPRLMSGEIEV
jgi:type I restriction enzyme S subunit